MRSNRALLPYALFAASGVAALVLETTWLRWFRLLFGATAPAASATLVAFFAGSALGAAFAARSLGQLRRPLAAYGTLELLAAGWALAVPLLLRLGEVVAGMAYDALYETPGALAVARFTIAFAATLPAAMCMGATFPVLGAAVVHDARDLGAAGSRLYAANLAGAAVGAALAAFLLPDWLGVHVTYAIGVGLFAGVGVAARVLDRGAEPKPAEPDERGEPGTTRAALLALAAASGFGALAAQVLLVHATAQVLNQSVYAFGAVLVCVLGCLAAGAALVDASERHRALEPNALLGGACVVAATGFLAFPALLFSLSDGLSYLGSDAAFPGYLGAALAGVLGSAGIPLLAAALVLPALFAAVRRDAEADDAGPPAAHLGRLAAANTAGAIAGALAAPYLLLPGAGLWGAFVVLAAVYGGMALLLPGATPRLRALAAAGLAVGALAILALGSPLALPLSVNQNGESVLFAASSPAGLVAVVEREGERLIRIDNHYALGGTAERVHEERQGHLPLLLHPGARRVAFVGTATGITAGAATAHPVESITLIEIAPRVADAAQRFFEDANRGVHRDPRARVVLDDARNHFAATRARYDAIVADLFVPWRSGTGALYAREHFEAVRERLDEGGLFCQWLPLYQLSPEEFRIVAATFTDVFPTAGLFRGDFFGDYPIAALVGWRGEPAPSHEVSRAAARLAVAGEHDRWITDPVGVWSLYVGPLAPVAADLAETPRNTDGRPRIQYLAARSHAGGERGKLQRMVGASWSAFSQAVDTAARNRDPLYPDLAEDARRASRGGGLFQAAGGLFVSGRHADASRTLATASERIPRHLLLDAPPDPTAADLWPDG